MGSALCRPCSTDFGTVAQSRSSLCREVASTRCAMRFSSASKSEEPAKPYRLSSEERLRLREQVRGQFDSNCPSSDRRAAASRRRWRLLDCVVRWARRRRSLVIKRLSAINVVNLSASGFLEVPQDWLTLRMSVTTARARMPRRCNPSCGRRSTAPWHWPARRWHRTSSCRRAAGLSGCIHAMTRTARSRLAGPG